MNTEPTFSPDELEAHEVRLLAVLLGEASAAETAAVETLVAAHPVLQALRARLVFTIGLLRDTARVATGEKAPAQLSPERRASLLAVLSGKPAASADVSANTTPTSTSETPPAASLALPRKVISFRQVLLHPYVGCAGLAACLVLGFAAINLPSFDRASPSSSALSARSYAKNSPQEANGKLQRSEWEFESKSSAPNIGDGVASTGVNRFSDSDGDRIVTAEKLNRTNDYAAVPAAAAKGAAYRAPQGPPPPAEMVPPASEPMVVTLNGGNTYAGVTTVTGGSLVVPDAKPAPPGAMPPSLPKGEASSRFNLGRETVSNAPAPAAKPAAAVMTPVPTTPAAPPPAPSRFDSSLADSSRKVSPDATLNGRMGGRGGAHGGTLELPAPAPVTATAAAPAKSPAKPSAMAKNGTGAVTLSGTVAADGLDMDGPAAGGSSSFGVDVASGPVAGDGKERRRSGGGGRPPASADTATLNFETASDDLRSARQSDTDGPRQRISQSESDKPRELADQGRPDPSQPTGDVNGPGSGAGIGGGGGSVRGLAMAGKREEAARKQPEGNADFFFTAPEQQLGGQKQAGAAGEAWAEKGAAAKDQGVVYYEDSVVASGGAMVDTRKGVKLGTAEGGFANGDVGGAAHFKRSEGEKVQNELSQARARQDEMDATNKITIHATPMDKVGEMSKSMRDKDSRDGADREGLIAERSAQAVQDQLPALGLLTDGVRGGLSKDLSDAKSDGSKELGEGRAKLRMIDEVSKLEKTADLQKKIGEQEELKSELKKSDAKENLAKAKMAAPDPALNPPDISAPVTTADNAFSTFALNVSDASFRLTRDHLNHGTWDATQIRPEEFYNAFSYRDPVPAASEPIGLTQETAAHPFTPGRLLVRLGIQTQAQGRTPQQPLHLTVLLDNSGSMERPDRRKAALAALNGLAQNLGPGDTVSLLSFSATPRLWLDQVSGEQAGKLPETAAQLPAEGGTNLEAALEAGYAQAARGLDPRSQNALVLLTDGSANLGNADAGTLANLVTANRLRGIAFHAYGVGQADLNDATLERLARNGDGRYAVLGTPEEALAQLVGPLAGSFRPAALDVKVQVEWNASRVKTHRLVGFAERRLTKEQFRDNSVDGGELAAAASGNALYSVEPIADGTGPLGTVRVRYRDPVTNTYRELSWPVAYDPGLPSFGSAPRGLRLAGVAALLAERLQGQPAAQDTNLDDLRKVADQLATEDGAEPIQGLAQMVRQAASLLNGR